jgi:hypothetical protein
MIDEWSTHIIPGSGTYNNKDVLQCRSLSPSTLWIIQPDLTIPVFEIWEPAKHEKIEDRPNYRTAYYDMLSTHESLPAAKLAYKMLRNTS